MGCTSKAMKFAVALPLLPVILLCVLKFLVFPSLGFHNSAGNCSPDMLAAYRAMDPQGRLKGKKALIILSQWEDMGAEISKETGKLEPIVTGDKTGFHIQEMAHPAYIFGDLGIDVDLASPNGGAANMNPVPAPVEWLFADWASDRFWKNDQNLKDKVANTLKISNVDFAKYDIISVTGGWSASYDLPVHEPLGAGLVKAFQAGNTSMGGICHGTVGLLAAVDPNTGKHIAEGRKCTGNTDKFSHQMGIWDAPGMYHPEITLRTMYKCDYVGQEMGRTPEFFAGDDLSKSVTVDGPFVFGQNQNVGCLYSYKLIEAMKSLQGFD